MSSCAPRSTVHGEHKNVTNDTQGNPLSGGSKLLDTGASMVQEFGPVNSICAHLNAFHVYADDLTRAVEANHYCTHLNEDVRQCLLFDSPKPGARLIGVEYMISPRLYETLEPSERRLWHSHVFEVKSGQLVMPKPGIVPDAVWEVAENKEMEEVVELYGKTYHLWQIDRGDKLPLGEPKLMMSITGEDMVPGFKEMMKDRDERFGVDSERKKEKRKYIEVPKIHPDADGGRGGKTA